MRLYSSPFARWAVIALLAALGLAACAPAPAPVVPAQAPTVVPPVAAATRTSIPGAVITPGGPADSAVKMARLQGFGLYLTDNADRTLYEFAKDSKDTSTCTGTCAQNWRAFIVQAMPLATTGVNATLLTTFKRPDGSLQLEYDGHPLYYFAGDKEPGDVKGQGIGNVWFVLSPRGNPMDKSAAPPTRTPSAP